MDITAAAHLARTLMRKHLSNNWYFEFSNRKGALGDTSYMHNRIRLSREFVRNATEAEVYNTITHEIAHALVGPGIGHGPTWQRQHIALGGNGSRTGEMTVTDYLYVGECACGKKDFKAHRLGSTLRNGIHKCGNSVTWTNTRTGQMTYRGGIVYSIVKGGKVYV